MMGEESLKTFLERNFSLIENKVFGLNEIENMIPWIRETYIQMFIIKLKERYQK